ncbi:MAG: adenylate/guanylate cyclase domain-containing protein [Acidimicrobiia bacterium]|jgi:predicted ATPase/class 3 adenylate cyclase
MPAFLFTDLESSTRIWEEHPESMREALAGHDAILRAAVEGAGGGVVKTTGDGLMAVFASVADSLGAALEAQRRLAATVWDEVGTLRVRMGIHAGDAQFRDGDYYGPAVNRAARIMSAGHGGQVLLSELAVSLAGEPLPTGVGLRDLGRHRLKDLTQPEHLYQLLHAELEADFPPPTTLDARPNNLPTQDSEFFGRRAELAEVLAMLDDPRIRLVTLTGPGGTGKTRLGLQVAAERLDRHRDGVFFVDLSPERDADAAFEAIARELGLIETGAVPLETLTEQLRDRQMLLVLDNFEQVTDAAVGLADLLQRCPELAIVVTSREALRIRAEHVFAVPPLSLPDPKASPAAISDSEAVSLFVERARAVRPDFALIDENAAAIAEICLRLDGLPLAIELAAARLTVFSPGDLRDRLRGRFDVLGGGPRDLPARHRTLRATIEWSHEMLAPDECRVFELMSVFSTARLDAVEAVAAAVGDLDVLDALVSLVDKSLIRSTESLGSRRFSMLQTIREYATERLDENAETAAAVRRAHALHYSEYAQGLRHLLQGPEREATLDDLAVEIGNLRSAWRFWVAEADLEQLYLLLDGLWALHDARGWYHAALELTRDMLAVLAKSDPSPERAAEEMTLRTSLARGLMALRGYDPEVEQAFREVLELVEAAGDTARRFPVLRSLATYYMNIADFEQASGIGRELLDLAAAEDDDTILVDAHFVFGANCAFAGDMETGLRHLDEAIRLFDPTMHGSGRFRLGTSPGVVAHIASALLRWQVGDLERAVADSSEAMALARRLQHPFSLAYALYHVGFLNLMRHRFEQSRELAAELEAVAAEHDYPVWGALASVLGGCALSGLGEPAEGLHMTEAGIDLYQGLTTPPVFWPLILALRATAFAAVGRVTEAMALIDEAIAINGPEEAVSPEFRVQRGDLIRMLPDGDLDDAQESYRAAIRGARQTGVRLVELQALTRLVDLRRSLGQVPDRGEELRDLYGSFTEGLDSPDLVAARTVLETD